MVKLALNLSVFSKYSEPGITHKRQRSGRDPVHKYIMHSMQVEAFFHLGIWRQQDVGPAQRY